jgi:Ca2+-binding RTX toxin-like protein
MPDFDFDANEFDANEVVNVTAGKSLTGNLTDNLIDSNLSVLVTSFTVAGDATVYDAADQPVEIANVGTLRIDNYGNYSFEPVADYSGSVPVITYTLINDEDFSEDTSTLTITVSSLPVNTLNNAPKGANKTVTTLEDSAYTLTAADFGFSDDDGNSLAAVKISSLPANGTLRYNGVAITLAQVTAGFEVLAANLGLLTFVPAAHANGSAYASFTFQVRDNGGTANGGMDLDLTPNTISFNVTPVNDAPAGTDGPVTLLEDSVKTFAASDFGFSDVDGDRLAAVKISSLPANGTLRYNGVAITPAQVTAGFEVLAANLGLLTFVPAANANGSAYASFTFQVRDDSASYGGSLDLTPNTITLNVTPVNDAPSGIATATLAPGTEDQVYTLNTSDLLVGFSDVDIATNGQVLSIVNLVSSDGTVKNNLDGTYTITPAANFNGAVTLTYDVTDGNGGTLTGQTTSFSIAAENDPITGSPNATLAAGTEDTAYTINAAQLLQGFSDVDIATNGQVLSITNLTSSNGTVTNNGNGIYTITPAANFNGSITLTYDVTDNQGSTLTAQTLSYTLNAVNDAPTGSATAVLGNGTEDTTYTISQAQLLDGFSDVDSATLSITDFATSNGTFVKNPDGSFTITPTLNSNGAVIVTYKVSDGEFSVNGSNTFTLTAVNDAPTGSASAVLAAGTEDTAYSISTADLLAGFTDVEGDSLSVTNFKVNGTALMTDAAGNYVFMPTANAHGDFTVTYDVSDGTDSTAASLGFSLTALNDTPVLTGAAATLAPGTEDTTYTVTKAQLLQGFTDVDGDTLSITNFTSSNGAVVENADGSFTITPDTNFNGVVNLTYQVSDGQASVDATQLFSLTAVNDAPTGSASAVLAAGTEDTAYTVTKAQLLQGFTDVDGDTLSITNFTSSNGAVVENADGSFTITPDTNFNGVVNLTYQVSDGQASVDATRLFSLTAVNDAPTGSASAVLAAGTEDTAYSISTADLLAGFTDVEGDSLSVTNFKVNGTALMTDAAGNYVFMPTANANGDFTVTYDVSDGTDSTAASLGFSLTALNDVPVLTGAAATLAPGTEDTAYTVTKAQLLQGFTDVEGDSLSITNFTSSNGAVVENADGSFTITPAANFNGIVNLTYKVSDGKASVDATQFFSLAANAILVDHRPTISPSSATVPTLTIDETVLATDASASFAGLFTSSFGNDGFKDTNNDKVQDADAISYALGINAGSTGLVDTQTNTAVVLSLVSGAVIGRAGTGGPEVFRITVDANTGLVTLDQKRSVVHNDPADPDESGTSAAELSAANLVTLTATITDRDLDSASATRNIGTAFKFKDDGPIVTSISRIYGYNTDQPLNGSYNFNVGADSVGNAAANGVILQGLTGVTAQGGTTPSGRAITDQTLTWSNETDTMVAYNFGFKYFVQPTATQQATATGTVTFNKTNGTYTFDLASAISGQEQFSTSAPLTTFNYDTQGNNFPEIVVQQYSSNFFAALTATVGPSGNTSGLVTIDLNGGSSNLQFLPGDLWKNSFTGYLNVSNATVGVNSDTIQRDELLNYDFYTANPVTGSGTSARINPSSTRAYADSLSITLDQITAPGGVAKEDIAILLKLYNPANNGYTTKLLIANNATDYKPVGSFFQVDVTSNNYDSTNYQIYGVQIVTSTENLTGTGFSLTGNNSVTLTAAGRDLEETSDSDVMKIIKLDVNTKPTQIFDTDLNFVGQLVDGDADSASFNFGVHLEADSSTLIGTAQSDYLTGTSAANILNGGGGNDILLGLGGADQLTGGNGNDRFLFNSPSEGIDTITDFTVTDDLIVVSKSGFGAGLSSNTVDSVINSNQFVPDSGTMTSSTRFIYNSSTGGLFYDPDGNGVAAALQFATLSSRPASITSANIFVAA